MLKGPNELSAKVLMLKYDALLVLFADGFLQLGLNNQPCKLLGCTLIRNLVLEVVFGMKEPQFDSA